jgi:hypothetical protein
VNQVAWKTGGRLDECPQRGTLEKRGGNQTPCKAFTSGDICVVAPPVPIPNTEVKHHSPDGSASTGCARVGSCQKYTTPSGESLMGFFFGVNGCPDASCGRLHRFSGWLSNAASGMVGWALRLPQERAIQRQAERPPYKTPNASMNWKRGVERRTATHFAGGVNRYFIMIANRQSAKITSTQKNDRKSPNVPMGGVPG